MIKQISRREMLKEWFSRDMVKGMVSAYTAFNEGLNEQNKLSGDEAIQKIANRLKNKTSKNISQSLRKEG